MRKFGGNPFRSASIVSIAVFLVAAAIPAAALDGHSENDFDNSEGRRSETSTSLNRDEDSAGVTLEILIATLGTADETDSSELDHPMLWGHYCGPTGQPFVAGATVSFTFETESPTIEGNGIYLVECNDATGAPNYAAGRFDFPIGAEPALDAATVRDFLETEIEIEGPAVETSPPFDTRPALVNTETWFWVTDPWGDRVDVVSISGYAVELTATPLRVEWDIDEPGFDGPLVCLGPGTVWEPGEDVTSCGHTFTRSSAGAGPNDAFTVTATNTWEYSWSLNGVNQGPFATIDGVTTFEIQVAEIQTVKSG